MQNKNNAGDRLGRRDVLFASAAGLVFTFVYLVFAAKGMDPALWRDLTVAAGIAPPQTIFPGVWRVVAHALLSFVGPGGIAFTLTVLGSIVGGLCVSLAYLVFRIVLAYLARVRNVPEWSHIASLFSLLAVASLGAGDAMMRVVSPLTPGGIRFIALLLSLYLFLRYIQTWRNWRILLSMAIAGAIASETPIGFLLPAVYYLCFRLSVIAVVNDQVRVEIDSDMIPSLPKWRMFFSFLLGLAVFAGINIYAFVCFGGIEACGWSGFDVAIHYALGYYGMVLSAASPIGWVLSMTFALLPLIGTLVVFPMLCRDTEPLRFKTGLILFFAGMLALLQCGVFPYTRLWTFSSSAAELRSDFLVCIFMLFSALTLALASACFSLGCQNFFAYDPEEGVFRAVEKRGFAMRNLVLFAVALCLLPVLFRIYRPAETEMRAIVRDALEETVRECGDAEYVFTDGRLDAGLELTAARMGSNVKPLNMMSGPSAWEKFMRCRSFEEGSPDRASAELGVPILLRIWAGEMTNRMDRAAQQLGFEFWKRARKPLPPQSGFVARVKGIDEAETARGVSAAEKIARRIITVMKENEGLAISPALRDALQSVSWRISRFARMRDDEELAKELDEWNEAVKHMMRLVDYERTRTFMQMTPYEGLRLALRRADFAEARRYGAIVLQMDPEDPEANFGTGMAYLMEEKLKEAEMYLERTLVKRPDEPAVLNNLSIIYRKTNRLEKALEYVKKAHELLPANDEISRTLRDTERAMEKRTSTLKSAFEK